MARLRATRSERGPLRAEVAMSPVARSATPQRVEVRAARPALRNSTPTASCAGPSSRPSRPIERSVNRTAIAAPAKACGPTSSAATPVSRATARAISDWTFSRCWCALPRRSASCAIAASRSREISRSCWSRPASSVIQARIRSTTSPVPVRRCSVARAMVSSTRSNRMSSLAGNQRRDGARRDVRALGDPRDGRGGVAAFDGQLGGRLHDGAPGAAVLALAQTERGVGWRHAQSISQICIIM